MMLHSGLNLAGCENVLVDSIKINNNDRGPNNDGIDPDSCRNVIIRNCIIESGDDAIVVKATRLMAERYGPCENIVIQGCILHSRDSALKIGTETFGAIHNIVMSDCIVKDCSRAIGIWSRDGGMISDIHIHHVIGNTRRYADCSQRAFAPRWWGKGEPIFISATKREKGECVPGTIQDIYFDHIYLTSESSFFIGGEEYTLIKNIEMKDSRIIWKKQSSHVPDVFDEQPSDRDVYEHEIPCIYGRWAKNVRIEAELVVDSTLNEVIRKQKILDQCESFEISESSGGAE